MLPPTPAGWQTAQLQAAWQFDRRSAHTGRLYRIFVSIPHTPAPVTGYPVLWMLDGAASFPLASVSLPRPMQAPQAGRRPGIAGLPVGLVVGIAHTGDSPFNVDARACDYTPAPDTDTGDQLSPEFGGAEAFRHFLVDELRPLIAAQFPLDANRHTLFGFSYGGLFTVDTLMSATAPFQRYWAASPSLWFSNALPMRRLREGASRLSPQVEQVMLTVGREEQYPSAELPPARLAHLTHRAMVSCVNEAAGLLASANPGVAIRNIVAAEHDHFDMLMHGARRVLEFAFVE
ncbi:alpha/beta hydrolase [Kerstersia similis]|uniref:alpha/beta hydrolase n=1 Tax=Kerstersia similis TaxID=206505 RepID=UPI0039EE890F